MIRRTVTKNGKKYQYYHCSTYKNGGGCTPHMINSEKLTESVLAAIRHQVTLLVEAEKVLSNAELASGEQIGIKILDSQIRIIFRHSRDGYLLESMRMRASAAHLWNTEKGCSS